jgi:P-type E1-E2 ATPase
VESHSEHPLGKAIVAYARNKGVFFKEITNFSMLPGKGISADLDGKNVLCGNSHYLAENGIDISSRTYEELARLQQQGKAAILASYAGVCCGLIALSDTLRDTARSMVAELLNNQTTTVLLTGDNLQAAEHFAEKAGITSVFAELLPAEKVEHIKELQAKGLNVCMIGDGINDAPALKTANVGVAMGSMGSDIAIEAADIALMGDDIAKIPYLKRLSNATVKTISLNNSISMVFNVITITLAILGILNPVTGALAHNAGSVAVVLNAALLYDRKY